MTLARRVGVWIAVALPVLAAALAALLWWGPVTVGDKKLMLDFLLGRGVDTPAEDVIARQLRAAPGFSVNLFAGDLPLARWLRPTSTGDLIVSRTRAGEVMLLERDRNGDAKADGRRILLTGLDRPHGLDIGQGWLYVAERTAVGRIRFDEQSGSTSGSYQHVITGLTGDGSHLTRTIRFGPDSMLYLAQGSTCNACIEEDKRRATIMRFATDGSGGEIFATGLRNSVGFDWAPWDAALYATENGRDLLGDDFPPDELNLIRQGQFYGWPFVNGFGVPDPDMRDASMLTIAVPPVHAFAPHNAPLGIRFLRSTRRPPGFEQAAVVALHGSWNRSKPDGYKVVSLHWTRDRIEQRDFLTGFLSDDGIIGRPADVAEGPDGAVYVSDDYAGAIYRVAPDFAPAPVQ